MWITSILISLLFWVSYDSFTNSSSKRFSRISTSVVIDGFIWHISMSLLKSSLNTDRLILLAGLFSSWTYNFKDHWMLQQAIFIVILHELHVANLPLIVTFLLHEQQRWYLLMLVTLRMFAFMSLTGKIMSSGWTGSGKASCNVIRHSSFLGVFKYRS